MNDESIIGSKLFDPVTSRYGEIVSIMDKKVSVFSKVTETKYRIKWLVQLDYPVYRTCTVNTATILEYDTIFNDNKTVDIKD